MTNEERALLLLLAQRVREMCVAAGVDPYSYLIGEFDRLCVVIGEAARNDA